MKKTLMALTAFALVLGGLFSCKQKAASVSGDPCTAVHARDYSGQKAEGMISLAQAMEITQLYYNDYDKSHIEIDGKVTKADVLDIAKTKFKDMNASSLEQAAKVIAGTARSMGIEIVD